MTNVSRGQAAIRERNFGTAIQLLKRAYREHPTPENAGWLATAYAEAGYKQLAQLYHQLAAAPKAPAPIPVSPPQGPTSSDPTRLTWSYQPTPIDPNSFSRRAPIKASSPDPGKNAGLTPPESIQLSRLRQLHRLYLDKANAEIALQLAEIYDDQGNLKEAQRYYRDVLDLDGSLMLRPMVQERLEEIRQMQQPAQGPTAHRLLEMADQHREQGSIEQAEQIYRQLLRMDAPLEVHNAARKGLIRLFPNGKP